MGRGWFLGVAVMVVACSDPNIVEPGGAGGESAGVGGVATSSSAGGQGEDPSSSSSSSSGGATSAGGDGGVGGEGGTGGEPPPPECLNPSDCPGADSDCAWRTCEAGSCGIAYAAQGTPTSAQTPDDCATVVCDGQGGTTEAYEGSDVVDDGNPCTEDVCTPQGGHQPSPKGQACNFTWICNGAGSCVASVPVVCKVPNGDTYTCPGPDGPNGMACGASSTCWTHIFFQDGATSVNCYPTSGTTHPWCPPGTPCEVHRPSPYPTYFGTCQ